MPDHYSSDELKSLVRILNDILAEARRCRPDLSKKDEIVERIFSRADSGERDAKKLHQAVFGARMDAKAEGRTAHKQKLSIAGMKNAMSAKSVSRRYRLA